VKVIQNLAQNPNCVGLRQREGKIPRTAIK